MTAQVLEEVEDGIAILRLDRPVANALAPDLRADLDAALVRAGDDPAVRGIVLTGAGRGFSSGIDLSEFEGPLAAPTVEDLCHRIETCPKPVVAALHGAVLGAGVALALAAHLRVAQSDARLALPEITLGMMPGGGVTQRAPRLLGAQVSLELMLTGRPVAAGDARLRRLFSEVVEAGVVARAQAHARHLADEGAWPLTCEVERGLSDPVGFQRAVASVTERLGGRGKGGAAGDILRAVEAAQLLPFSQGLAFEETLFEERLQRPEARAQRHVYAAERRAAGIPELRRAQARPVRRVALRGAVPVEIALLLMRHGRRITTDLPDLAGAVEAAVEGGNAGLPDGAARPDISQDTAGADLIIRATDAPGPPKAAEVVCDTGQGFQGQSLGLRLDAALSRRPPVEIGVPETAAPADVATLAGMLAELGCTTVRAQLPAAGPGLGHVMMGTLCLAGLALVRSGATPFEVDRGARSLGLEQGPFQWMDQIGHPQAKERLQRVNLWLGAADPGLFHGLDERIGRGATGRSVGRGFYDYPPDGPRPAKGYADIVRAGAPVSGPCPVGPGDALHAALVCAALKLIERGAVQRASDIDVIMVRAHGYDRRRGGPLLAADQRGLLAVLKDMRLLEIHAPAIWQPPEAVSRMVKNGEGFFGRAAAVASG